MSDSVRPHRRQPTRLSCPWDSPGKNTGVGCHFLLQCMKAKSERYCIIKKKNVKKNPQSRRQSMIMSILHYQMSSEGSYFEKECFLSLLFYYMKLNIILLYLNHISSFGGGTTLPYNITWSIFFVFPISFL